MSSLPVTFFYPYPDELESLGEIDLEDPVFWSHEGKGRRRAWILQTYLRLESAGHPVSISATLPEQGIVVLLPESPILEHFQHQFTHRHRNLVIVTVRADTSVYRSYLGDVDIVQNGRFANEDRGVFFIPHWPQPGLIPRDPDRGTTIENIVFKGGFGSLRSDFRSARWKKFLRRRNLSFHIASAETEGEIPSWHDYRTADLNLAVRPSYGDGGLRCEKPASKLVNAWHAGVPSLLGVEYAYRELRTSSLDYIEVETLDDAMSAIDTLRENPSLYEQMVEHGRSRAREFTPSRITERWARLLFETVPEVARRPTRRGVRMLPKPLRTGANFLLSPPSPYEFRKILGHEMRRARTRLISLWS
jgi:hypothetical protein